MLYPTFEDYDHRSHLVHLIDRECVDLLELSNSHNCGDSTSSSHVIDTIYDDSISLAYMFENEMFAKEDSQSKNIENNLRQPQQGYVKIIQNFENPDFCSNYSQEPYSETAQEPLLTQSQEQLELRVQQKLSSEINNKQQLANEKQGTTLLPIVLSRKRTNKDSVWKKLLRKFRKDIRQSYISQEGPNAYLLSQERLIEKVMRFFMTYLGEKATFSSELMEDDDLVGLSQTEFRKVKFILLIAPTMRKKNITLIESYQDIVSSLRLHYIDIYQNNNDVLLRRFLKDPLLKFLFTNFIEHNQHLIEELDEGERHLLQKDFVEYGLKWPL